MNTYIQLIQEISYDNKYTRWYINIIQTAILRANTRKEANELLIKCESHHIVPECAFKIRKRKGPPGFLDGNSNEKENVAFLSFREHFIVHMLLIKMIKNENLRCRLSSAIFKMKDYEKYPNSITYETAKLLSSKNHIMRTEEYRKLTSENMTNFYASEKGREVMSLKSEMQKITMIGAGNPMFGRESSFSGESHTEEFKEKMKNKTGDKHHNTGKKINTKKFKIIDPNGNVFITTDMKNFCTEHNIKINVLYNSRYKNKPIEGWSCYLISEPKAILIDPNGNEHEIYNIKQFCKENELYYQCIIHVIGGTKPQHKGWTGYKINRE
jgi:hypothetical protein